RRFGFCRASHYFLIWICHNTYMTEHEQAFLAQVALGWFTVKPNGTIWRNIRFHGGGPATGVAGLTWITPTRAERSVSAKGKYLRVMFYDRGRRRKSQRIESCG